MKEKGETHAQLASKNERLETVLQQAEQLKTERDEAKTSQDEATKKALEFEVQAGHYKEQLEQFMARFSISESEPDSKKKK